jgi:hypothetical protein
VSLHEQRKVIIAKSTCMHYYKPTRLKNKLQVMK